MKSISKDPIAVHVLCDLRRCSSLASAASCRSPREALDAASGTRERSGRGAGTNSQDDPEDAAMQK